MGWLANRIRTALLQRQDGSQPEEVASADETDEDAVQAAGRRGAIAALGRLRAGEGRTDLDDCGRERPVPGRDDP